MCSCVLLLHFKTLSLTFNLQMRQRRNIGIYESPCEHFNTFKQYLFAVTVLNDPEAWANGLCPFGSKRCAVTTVTTPCALRREKVHCRSVCKWGFSDSHVYPTETSQCTVECHFFFSKSPWYPANRLATLQSPIHDLIADRPRPSVHVVFSDWDVHN